MKVHPILKSYVIKDFKKLAEEIFEKESAFVLYQKACKLALEYAEEYGNITIEEAKHYFGQILPFIAVYKVLQTEAPEKVDEVLTQIIHNKAQRANKLLTGILKFPGLYRKVPLICNSLVMKTFGVEVGFQYGSVECTPTRWKADMLKCPYFDTCKKYDCPEIAHYFCDSDDLIYGTIHKKICWKRTKTLGRGDAVCDFGIEII